MFQLFANLSILEQFHVKALKDMHKQGIVAIINRCFILGHTARTMFMHILLYIVALLVYIDVYLFLFFIPKLPEFFL